MQESRKQRSAERSHYGKVDYLPTCRKKNYIKSYHLSTSETSTATKNSERGVDDEKVPRSVHLFAIFEVLKIINLFDQRSMPIQDGKA